MQKIYRIKSINHYFKFFNLSLLSIISNSLEFALYVRKLSYLQSIRFLFQSQSSIRLLKNFNFQKFIWPRLIQSFYVIDYTTIQPAD